LLISEYPKPSPTRRKRRHRPPLVWVVFWGYVGEFMDEYLKKLYKKYDLNDWFDIEAYEFEPTPARWAEIINSRLMAEGFTTGISKRTSFKKFQTSNPDLSHFSEEYFNFFRGLNEEDCLGLRNFLLRSYDDFRKWRFRIKNQIRSPYKKLKTSFVRWKMSL
jgi:hypothetical protein